MMTLQNKGLMFLACWLGSGLGTLTVSAQMLDAVPADAALAVIEEGAVSRAVGATRLQGEDGQVHIAVEGLTFQEVTAWIADGQDLGGALEAALAEGTATVRETAVGFELV